MVCKSVFLLIEGIEFGRAMLFSCRWFRVKAAHEMS